MPSSAPAKPAMAAEITNTPSLVTIGLMPSVAHAAGLSPSAVSRRPKRLLCNQTTRTPTTPSAAVMKKSVPTSCPKWMPRKSNGWLKSNPRISIGPIGLPSKPRISGWGKNRIAAICAKAMDASARYRPWSRNAGSAIATPNGIANSAATIMPPTLPRSGAHCRYANAPAPTNVICANEICFDQPVSGTSDTMMKMVSTARVSWRVPTRSAMSAIRNTTTNRMNMPSAAILSLGIRGATCRMAFFPSMRA